MAKRNWNRDPFEGGYNPITITDYPMTVGLDPDLGKYGLRLPFAPLRTQSSGNMTIKRASDNFELTEVSRTTSPSTNEYRVDYEADTYLGTGWTQFNGANDGLQVLVSCKISGDLIVGGAIPELGEDNTWTGNQTFTGATSFDGPIENSSTTFGLNIASNGTIRHYGTPVWGYDISGNPVYCKILTGTTVAATNYVNHGISGSPVTNAKIVDFSIMLLEASTPEVYKVGVESSSLSPYYTTSKSINNAQVVFTQSTPTAGVTYYITILYKK